MNALRAHAADASHTTRGLDAVAKIGRGDTTLQSRKGAY